MREHKSYIVIDGYVVPRNMIDQHTDQGVILKDGRVFNGKEATA